MFRGTNRALNLDDVTRAFKGAKKKDVEAVLESLTALGLLTVLDSNGSRRWRSNRSADSHGIALSGERKRRPL